MTYAIFTLRHGRAMVPVKHLGTPGMYLTYDTATACYESARDLEYFTGGRYLACECHIVNGRPVHKGF